MGISLESEGLLEALLAVGFLDVACKFVLKVRIQSNGRREGQLKVRGGTVTGLQKHRIVFEALEGLIGRFLNKLISAHGDDSGRFLSLLLHETASESAERHFGSERVGCHAAGLFADHFPGLGLEHLAGPLRGFTFLGVREQIFALRVVTGLGSFQINRGRVDRVTDLLDLPDDDLGFNDFAHDGGIDQRVSVEGGKEYSGSEHASAKTRFQ